MKKRQDFCKICKKSYRLKRDYLNSGVNYFTRETYSPERVSTRITSPI
nr:MAG TPA: hypothetical protein [Caudoviricetes sp.]